MRYILHYTQPGDIVVDGFAGTGMTGVAAAACGIPTGDSKAEIEADFKENGFKKPKWGFRHAVCGDLSPICFHISSNYNSKVNTEALKIAVNEIIAALQKRFGHFYEFPISMGNQRYVGHINYFVWSEVVGCKNCGQELNVHDLSFDYDTKELFSKLKCPTCGSLQARTEANSLYETVYDEQLSEPVSQLKYECCLLNYSIPKKGRFFSASIPVHEFPEYIGNVPTDLFGDGDKYGDPKRVGAYAINQLYYKRTKYVLAYLQHLIKNDYKTLEKPLMFIFTSMLPKLTRMNRYMPQHGSRALVGPMANTLYIPPQGVENNPIDQFEYQAGKVIRAFEQCNNASAIQVCSATNSSFPDNSVDYIFTDPPFGANIMYSELNYISESWLKVRTNNVEEAVSNKTQHKDLPEYQNIMTACFREYNRILKPGRWMTVEFSNTSASFWNSLQYAIKSAGFIISAITDLNKERGGLHSMLGPVAVKQDLAISCYKPSTEIVEKIKIGSESSLWDVVYEHLSHTAKFIQKGEKTVYISERDPRIIYNRIISYYVQHDLTIPVDSNKFQQGLKERFVERDGMFFTADDAIKYETMRRKNPNFETTLGILISCEADGIQWLKNRLRDKSMTYQEIQPNWMQDLVQPKKGDKIPELKDILEENFLQDEEGRWFIPDLEKEADLERVRTKQLLREFASYVSVANETRGRIKEARLEALRLGFRHYYLNLHDYQSIVKVAERIPQTLLNEDDVLLQIYDMASMRL